MSHEHLKGSVEARLDRLKKRLAELELQDVMSRTQKLAAVLKGTLDLLSDVLLEEKPDGKR